MLDICVFLYIKLSLEKKQQNMTKEFFDTIYIKQ